MPRADGTFYNSWEMAQAHEGAWLENSDVRWGLHASKGKGFKSSSGPQAIKSFRTFTEAAEWAEKHLKITGWKRDRWGAYHPSETDHEMACDGVPPRSCNNKRKPGETLCGVHLNVRRRDVERAERMREMTEGWERDTQLRKDCRAAAEPLGIPIHSSGQVTMHAEDFLALCRELTELRELREFV